MTTRALLEAMKAGNAARVRALLEADPRLAEARSETGVSALLIAIYHGRLAAVEAICARLGTLDLCEAAALGDAERVRRAA